MSKAQKRHERQVRKFHYNIGDQVLVNHPYFGSKKGLSKGLAKVYKGIYEVIGINPNNVDYIKRQVDSEKNKSQPFKIHKID